MSDYKLYAFTLTHKDGTQESFEAVLSPVSARDVREMYASLCDKYEGAILTEVESEPVYVGRDRTRSRTTRNTFRHSHAHTSALTRG